MIRLLPSGEESLRQHVYLTLGRRVRCSLYVQVLFQGYGSLDLEI